MQKITFITPDFAVAGQLEAEDFAEIARLGFKTVLNNRPDGEENSQLPNYAAASHALLSGLDYHYIPSGKLDLFSDQVVNAAETALRAANGPVLAYCKSGTRSAIIWAAASARNLPVDEVLALLLNAGFDFDFLRDDLQLQASAGSRVAADGEAPVELLEAA
ncbi:MAG: TIGR01244 family sulfur transferase [Rhodomicrobium sp.]